MMIPFLDRLRKVPLVGMDIGVTGIKLARLRRRNDGTIEAISHWLYPENPFGAAQGEGDIPRFRDFLRQEQLTNVPVACSIEEASLKIRRVELPKMPDADLKEALQWQLRDVVEGPMSEYIVRHSLIEEFSVGDVKKLSLLAYAIRKNAVTKRVEVLKKLSLKPVVIEPAAVSLLALFDHLHDWKEGEVYGIVNLGESGSYFSVMENGKLYFSRPLGGVSGKQFREVIEKEIGVPPSMATNFKEILMRGGDFSKTPDMKERLEALLPLLHTRIAVELQKSVDAYTLMFRREKIDRLFLCGGGASLKGVQDFLTKNLAIPTEVLDPSAPFSASLNCLYDVALGLALYPL